jgi:transposase
MPNDEDYWFDSKSCFHCGNTNLATELREGDRVLYCKDCGLINAAIRDSQSHKKEADD